MVTNAVTPFPPKRTGLISAYVSSLDKITLMASLPSSVSFKRFGKSLYASGPTTKSTNCSSSKNLVLRRSAIQPRTPTVRLGLSFFKFLNCESRILTVCSALSLIEQVFSKIKSASSTFMVVL